MKARVKATGEVIEVAIYSAVFEIGGSRRFNLEEVELIEDDLPIGPMDYWTRLEHQYAGMAMQGLCANYTEFTKDNDGTLSNTEMIVENARLIAHALVEKLKEKEE